MSDGDGDPAAAAGLERPLAELAPLLRRRAAAQEPDPAFVRALRARLVAAPSTAHPPRSRPRQAHRRRRALGQAILVTPLVALLALALAVAIVAWYQRLSSLLVAAIATIVLVTARRHWRQRSSLPPEPPTAPPRNALAASTTGDGPQSPQPPPPPPFPSTPRRTTYTLLVLSSHPDDARRALL